MIVACWFLMSKLSDAQSRDVPKGTERPLNSRNCWAVTVAADLLPNSISFADALHWLRHAGPRDELPELIVNLHRPNRIEPRVVKRRPKPYDLMNRPREQLRKALRRRKKAA